MTASSQLLITGVPRSGTTLLTATIGKIPNVVALSEPIQQRELKHALSSPMEYACRLMELMQTLRRQILDGVPLPNRFDKENHEVASNYWRSIEGEAGRQMVATSEVREEVIAVQDENFILCIKNCEQFTSCLEALAQLPGISIIAVVRNPVACLLSWRSLSIPISQGRIKFGEKFHRELRKIRRIEDVLLRQVKVLDWYFGSYYRHREKVKIIRYEDFVEKPDLLREIIDVPASHAFSKHQSMNKRPEYNHADAETISEYLNRHTQFVRYFYPSF
jgi:hypothetical protein